MYHNDDIKMILNRINIEDDHISCECTHQTNLLCCVYYSSFIVTNF